MKHIVVEGLYYDFDLKNAQPEIIRNICLANGISCSAITEYCQHRDAKLELVQTTYDVDRATAKKLFLRLCFFGTFEGWAKEENITGTPLSFIQEFRNELNRIATEIKAKNPLLFDTARKLKEAKQEGNHIGSMFALFLQEYEERIVQQVLNYLMNNTELMNHPSHPQSKLKVGIYEYDGVKLLKEQVVKFGGKANVMSLLNRITNEITNFELEWEEKPIEGAFDISTHLEKLKEQKSTTPIGVWDDGDATDTLYKLYPHWVYCKDTLYVFDQETGLWNDDHTSHLKIIRQFDDKLKVLDTNSKGEVIQTNRSYGNTLTLME